MGWDQFQRVFTGYRFTVKFGVFQVSLIRTLAAHRRFYANCLEFACRKKEEKKKKKKKGTCFVESTKISEAKDSKVESILF